MDPEQELTVDVCYGHGYSFARHVFLQKGLDGPRVCGSDPVLTLRQIRARIDRELGKTEAARMAYRAIVAGISDAAEGLKPRR